MALPLLFTIMFLTGAGALHCPSDVLCHDTSLQTMLFQMDVKTMELNMSTLPEGKGDYQPINSAGDQTLTVEKAMDLLLCLGFMAVPFVIYLLIQYRKYVLLAKDNQGGDKAPSNIGSRRMSEDRLGKYDEPETPQLTRLTGDDLGRSQSQEAPQKMSPVSVFSSQDGLFGGDDSQGTILQNILAGMTTAVVAAPDAISFSLMAGTSPLNGLWAGVFMALSAALVGGRPGMISCSSAATTMVIADVSADPDLGQGAMALTVFLIAICQFLAAYFKLSKFVSLIPA